MTNLAAAIGALAGRRVDTVESLGGGSLSEVHLVTFMDGEIAVAKQGPAEQLRVEAAMLRHMAAEADVPVPQLLGEGDGLLLLEWRPHDGGFAAAWADVAHRLAMLHAVGAERYGFRLDYALGPVAQPNGFADDWVSFWRERRLLPLARPLPARLRTRVEMVATRLGELIPADPKPSLLHGDCWSGNLLVDGGRLTAFIDPACYYGDAEVDLAMLSLFSTLPDGFWSAYGRPDRGFFETRQAVYQLWPILVHVRLFGSSYLPMLEERLAKLGA